MENLNENLVIIKKYPNRRLYNMQTSSYITLDNLANMVKEGAEFKVIDAKTDKDLTRSVLMQVLLEQETGGAELLPLSLLKSLIRYCETDMHHTLSSYLTDTMSLFTQNQDQMVDKMKSLGGWDQWQNMQAEWLKNMEAMNPLNTKPSSKND